MTALLGAQTRAHNDIDIVLHAHAVPALRALLEARGYTDVPRDDTCPWNFVLGDDHGHEVDFHAIVLDAATGNGIYGPPEDGVFFPAAGLAGATGSVLGRAVRCLTPQQIVIFHTQYTPDANDIADVAALCAHFSIPYPASYPPAQ